MKKLQLLCISLIVFFVGCSGVFAGVGYGPGRIGLKILAGRDHVDVGNGGIWNSRDKLHIQIDPADSWRIKGYHVDLGGEADYLPPLGPTGNPKIGHFDYKEEFTSPYVNVDNLDGCAFRRTLVLELEEDLAFRWGTPYAVDRTQGVAIFLSLVQLDGEGNVIRESGAWMVPELVVWAEEDTVGEAIAEEEAVVDAGTGESIAAEVTEVKWVGKGTKVSKVEHQKAQKSWVVEELEDVTAFDGGRWGWWFSYEMAHPRTGHFIDSPVAGLSVQTPTYEGITDVNAAFDYFPGEAVDVSLGAILLGSTVADHKISPLDIFPASDTDDIRVINMARLLQSFDVDGDPQGGINITAPVAAAFEQVMGYLGLTSINFSDDMLVGDIINMTISNAGQLDPPLYLTAVSAEDAQIHLAETLNNVMFRKNISKTPEQGSTKAKMNMSTVWFPAMRANDEATVIEYFDEEGNLIRTAEKAKPIIITYTDADPVTHAMDTWAAISRDDGETWKRKNLSRSADLSSFTLANGEPYYGYVKKPVFQVKGNKIVVAWTSKFARGGKPAYAIDDNDEYTFDDPYYTDDIWGVGGPQRSVDYVEQGFPEVGEIPYSAVWTCRGVIANGTDVANGVGEFIGDIVWFKPERLTSARRDANLIFLAGASSAGFGMVWQEDPKGLRPGRAVGPGPGWGGATTNHKTDIWYSFITWGNHSKVDWDFVAGGDPEHDLDITRPKALVPMSLPIRLSDNEVLNQKNMGLDTTTTADAITYLSDNLTRCVKFEGGLTIVEADDPRAFDGTADYATLRPLPDDHQATMNCVNCHVPYGMDALADIPTQGAPIPLVVIDAAANEYLGGFSNGDCVSCHYSNIVPRDRLIAMAPGLDDAVKFVECEAKGGIWKDGSDGDAIVEAYYPYDGYPYIYESSDANDGTHRYGLELPGLLVETPGVDSPDFYTFTNFSGAETSVGITLGEDGIAGNADDLLMDGDTGASRGNLFLQPYTAYKPDGTAYTSAWAIVTYEETKGAGAGPPENTGEADTHRDDYIPESGKNAIYHSFDFTKPDMVKAGDIMNMPECLMTEGIDEYGNEIVEPMLDGEGNITPTYLTTEAGEQILDWKYRPQLAYENARRGRFILQGWGAVRSSRTVMMMVYKMGMEGAGRPSDIMTHRWVIPEEEIIFKYKDGKISGVLSVEGNPYRFENIFGNRVYDDLAENWYWGSGPMNMSSVTPTVTTESAGDPEYDDAYGAVKVVEWMQTVENLADLSDKNHFDDARAHRGQLRGDFVQLGFSYCANWAASRNGNDKYDFFIRRSFNGGQTWTTKPAGQGGAGVEHCITWTYPSGTESPGDKVEECTFYPAGEFEAMRNLTQLPNAKESVIEPRIVAVPGTIKVAGVWTGIPEDKQNQNVFYVAWGTSTNPKKVLDPVTGEMVQEEPHPTDLYWSFSMDKGETYHVDEWVVNPDSDGGLAGETVYGTPWMAKGDQEQGEVQLRMTPDGTRFYASWLDEGEEGSDIVFRRIMSADFPQNNAATATTAVAIEPEEDESSSDDFSSDSGGSDD
jgi:hypothetical protein